MKTIGLTGSIGSGKSTVASYLKAKGYPVFDADEVSRQLTAPGGKALKAIRETFGDEVFSSDGNLDRKKMARLVFSDEEAKSKLEEIVTRKVISAMKKWVKERKEEGKARLIVLDAPLLLETGAEKNCDEVWVVACDDHIRIARILNRGDLTEKEARARIAAQMPQEEKIARADVVIYNNHSRKTLLAKLRKLLKEYSK